MIDLYSRRMEIGWRYIAGGSVGAFALVAAFGVTHEWRGAEETTYSSPLSLEMACERPVDDLQLQPGPTEATIDDCNNSPTHVYESNPARIDPRAEFFIGNLVQFDYACGLLPKDDKGPACSVAA